jgi:hypothetical protein
MIRRIASLGTMATLLIQVLTSASAQSASPPQPPTGFGPSSRWGKWPDIKFQNPLSTNGFGAPSSWINTERPKDSGKKPTIKSYSWTLSPIAKQPFGGTVEGTGFVSGGTQVWFCSSGSAKCYQQPTALVKVTDSSKLNLTNVNLDSGIWQLYVTTSAGQSNNSSSFTVGINSPINIEIRRQDSGEKCTSGKLYVNGKFISYTLEPAWKENHELSSIPAGTYRTHIRTDHADNWRIELLDVPNRTNIQIHIGNTIGAPPDGDSVGCVLVGDKVDACFSADSVSAYRKLKTAIYGSENPVPIPDRKITVTVVDELPTPKAVVSTSLQLAEGKGPFKVGQKLDGSFSISNRGKANLVMKQLLITARVSATCPEKACPDFAPIEKTLAPGQTFNYSGTFTPQRDGTYTFYVAFQRPDQTWVNPVDTEKGSINKLTFVVEAPGSVLTGASPTPIFARPTAQIVYINGINLSRVLYCKVQFPDGKSTYIYMPLGEVTARTNEQFQTKFKWTTRGAYQIWAYTKDGHKSNGLSIVVN